MLVETEKMTAGGDWTSFAVNWQNKLKDIWINPMNHKTLKTQVLIYEIIYIYIYIYILDYSHILNFLPHCTLPGLAQVFGGQQQTLMNVQQPTGEIHQTCISSLVTLTTLRDCVCISTVVHATVAYLFSRHFPAYSVPRPILKV